MLLLSLKTALAGLAVFSLAAGGSAGEEAPKLVRDGFAYAENQYRGLLAAIAGRDGLPRTFAEGEVVMLPPKAWTSGFFPGALWLLFEETQDPFWRDAATRYTGRLAGIENYGGTHDLGFMLLCSYGQGYRLTHEPAWRGILLQGARTLRSRFNPQVGAIRSWDSEEWSHPVIIDNMMNLELLMFAFDATGDEEFRSVAVQHANTTMRNHFRPDGSSWHLVDFDPQTGAVKRKQTVQGFADDSAWARGQAWGLYGFTAMYRWTRDPAYLKQARKIADFLVDHPRMPADKVPYWDFDAPDIPHALRDVSAAAIMSSALLELASQTGEDGGHYRAVAEQQLRSLSAPPYRASPGENGGFLLQHGVGNKPKGSEVDVPLIYADYYYLEALRRLEAWPDSP